MAPCNLRGAEKCWPLAKCLLVVGGKVAKWSVGLEVSELVRCKLCSCLAPLLHCLVDIQPSLALKLSSEGLLPCWGNS